MEESSSAVARKPRVPFYWWPVWMLLLALARHNVRVEQPSGYLRTAGENPLSTDRLWDMMMMAGE